MTKRTLVIYSFIFCVVVALDRITKAWALAFLDVEHRFNKYLSFDLALNRGISWSMLHTENDARFMLLTAVILGAVVLLAAYTYHRYQETTFILGEVFVLAGALSNVVDRFIYRGVIDFIVVSAYDFVWPTFNLADASIVAGVFIMLISVYRKT